MDQELLELDEPAVSFFPDDDEDPESRFDSEDFDSEDFDSEADDSLPESLLADSEAPLAPDFDDRLSVL